MTRAPSVLAQFRVMRQRSVIVPYLRACRGMITVAEASRELERQEAIARRRGWRERARVLAALSETLPVAARKSRRAVQRKQR